MQRSEEPTYSPFETAAFNEEDFYRSGRFLWLSVIKRAIEESKGVNLIVDSRHGPIEKIRREQAKIQQEARRWLGDTSEGLETVCEWAGVDVREVLRAWRNNDGLPNK